MRPRVSAWTLTTNRSMVRCVRVSELLTSAEVAHRLGVKPALLRTWRHRGQGPRWSRIGPAVVYRESDVSKWEANQGAREASA